MTNKIEEHYSKQKAEEYLKCNNGNLKIKLYDSHFINIDYDEEGSLIIRLSALGVRSIKDYEFIGQGPIIISNIPIGNNDV